MTRGVVIALGVAAAVLAFIVIKMRAGYTAGLGGGVPYYTPGAPNVPGGPPLPGANKLSTFLQGVTATANAGAGAADAITSLWQKTGKSWLSSDDNGGSYDTDFVNSLSDLQS